MKGWEETMPDAFPIERLHRDAVREAQRRRRRRRRSYQAIASGVCAPLLVGLAVVVVERDDPGDQLLTGPSPGGRGLSPASDSGAVGLASGVSADPARINGKIAFLRRVGATPPATIWLMNEDGSGQTMIAETTGGAHLTWSPSWCPPAARRRSTRRGAAPTSWRSAEATRPVPGGHPTAPRSSSRCSSGTGRERDPAPRTGGRGRSGESAATTLELARLGRRVTRRSS